MNKQRYLVCFDISDDKKRKKVAKRLLSLGERVQWSVFEVELCKTAAQSLYSESVDDITETDRFFMYPLCSKCVDLIKRNLSLTHESAMLLI